MGELRHWIRLATGRDPAPTTYWTDELPTWLAVPVVIIRALLAIAAAYALITLIGLLL